MTPEQIRVKLVSEAAEYVSVTHVVQRDFNLAELVGIILPVVGRDAGRIRQMLHVGTVSTGEYRYRWQGVDVEPQELETVLEKFPTAEPSRPFAPAACFAVRFRKALEVLDLPRDSTSKKPLFAKQSFWDGLLEFAQRAQYSAYNYADMADVFSLTVDAGVLNALAGLLPLLKPKSASERLERFRPEKIEWLVSR